MKLNNAEFKRFKELQGKLKDGTISQEEKVELAKLSAKKQAKDESNSDGVAKDNPIEFWNKYPELLKDSANVPFNLIKGAKSLDFSTVKYDNNYATESFSQNDANHCTLGVRVDYTRTPGMCKSSTDAFNYQMRLLWTNMHRKYRGLGKYQKSDLGIAIYCIATAFADIARAERIYGVLNYYNTRNRSYPTTLLRALGINPNADFSGDDIASFRYRLNRLIVQAKNLCLPKGMSILESFVAIDSSVFTDSDSERASWIVYDTDTMVHFDPTTKFGSSAKYTSRTHSDETAQIGSFQTLDDIITDLNYVFDCLLDDDDINIICSDLLAYFADNELITLSSMPEDYEIKPLRHDNRLLQFHNSILTGQLTVTNVPHDLYGGIQSTLDNFNNPVGDVDAYADGLVVYQEDNVIKFEAKCTLKQPETLSYAVDNYGKLNSNQYGESPMAMDGYALLDIWKDDVSAEDIMEMTRQTTILTASGVTFTTQKASLFELQTFSHIITNAITMFSSVDPEVYESKIVLTYNVLESERFGDMAARGYLSQVDWAPVMLVHDYYMYLTNKRYYNTISGDIDNFTSIDVATLKAIHDAAMMSAWKIDKSSKMAPAPQN